LGTSCSSPDIHREFIASKAPDAKTTEEEVEALGVEDVINKTMTVFPRLDGKPFIYDYQLKGFFKDTCSALARVPDTKSAGLKAYRKIIDGCIFVFPRKISYELPEGGKIGSCQRPLLANTPQGARVALANSETVPIGTSITFEVHALNDAHEKVVREWLDYGMLRGLGQWRNSGKGRFSWEEIS